MCIYASVDQISTKSKFIISLKCFEMIYNVWKKFESSKRPNGAIWGQTGSNAAKLSQTGSNGAKQIQRGPNRAKRCQTGSNLAKQGQAGPNRAKWGQTESNRSKNILIYSPLCEFNIMIFSLPEEFTSLLKQILLIFFNWRIYTSVWVYHNGIFQLKITHLWASPVHDCFHMKNIHLCVSPISWYFWIDYYKL